MPLLTINDFSFYYPDAKSAAVANFSGKMEEGSFTVLFGKSGSGKTTLLRQLKPVLAPHGEKTGKIFFENRPLDTLPLREQTTAIGYVLQNPENQLVTDKVWHELAFGLESLGYDSATIRLRVAEMASYFGLQNWFHKEVAELSGGQKQLLNLASVMTLHPRLLILDEPTSQLDPIATTEFLETIAKINREIGTTILLTEHRLQEALPMADQVWLMEEGRLTVEGTPQKVSQILSDSPNDLFAAMPAPVQIFAHASQQNTPIPLTVREGRTWLETLSLRKFPVQADQPINKSKQPIIEVKDVWFRYQSEAEDILKDFSFQVKKGSFTGIVGGNGAGKSTMLSLLAGLNHPYRGKIKILGKKIERFSDQELHVDLLGVLPQNPQSLFVKKTVGAELADMLQPNRVTSQMTTQQLITGIAETAKLENLLDRHPYDLSGGEQQRLALAKILLLRPKILLLDEPTKGLDAFYKNELGHLLKELQAQGVTIVMVSHDIEFIAEYADTCGLFFDGQIISTKNAKAFFAGNHFYTTAANRMARKYFPNAVTIEDVKKCLDEQKNF